MKLNETNYIERDVSWMYFNRRILDEAQRSDILHVSLPNLWRLPAPYLCRSPGVTTMVAI